MISKAFVFIFMLTNLLKSHTQGPVLCLIVIVLNGALLHHCLNAGSSTSVGKPFLQSGIGVMNSMWSLEREDVSIFLSFSSSPWRPIHAKYRLRE